MIKARANILCERLLAHSRTFHKVVEFDPAREKLTALDFSEENDELPAIDLNDTAAFAAYVNKKLKKAHAAYGIGGYNELRAIYKRSPLFRARNAASAPVPQPSGDSTRAIHLGIDIWGREGTRVYAPLGGMVHSYAFNDNFGDYGATIILLHQLDTVTFYTLYGHLSLEDLAKITEFQYITRGQVIGHFGKPEENGDWPPHLHFQIIKDIRVNKGDYPGVCSFSDREYYLANCPDPDLILGMMQYV